MPLISVIVPVYNVEQYLHRCVDSILAQTFVDFELILVDDGSPDGCPAICDAYAVKDSRVRVIHQENKRLPAARNAGLCIAGGDYIAFVDSDDYIDRDYLSKLLEVKSDLTICGSITSTNEGECLKILRYDAAIYEKCTSIDFSGLYRQLALYSSYCRLYRADVIREHKIRFADRFTWGEDGAFNADYLRYVNSVALIDYSGYHYIKYPEMQGRLSTSVRSDIIDVVAASREYCISSMKEIHREQYESVRAVIEKDILGNVAYFVRKVLDNRTMPRREKKQLMDRFLQNGYVQETFRQSAIYYPDMEKRVKPDFSDGRSVIFAYELGKRKRDCVIWIYENLYQRAPDWIRNVVKTVRRGAKK